MSIYEAAPGKWSVYYDGNYIGQTAEPITIKYGDTYRIDPGDIMADPYEKEVAIRIINALGMDPKRVRDFQINFPLRERPTVTVEFVPNRFQLAELADVVEQSGMQVGELPIEYALPAERDPRGESPVGAAMTAYEYGAKVALEREHAMMKAMIPEGAMIDEIQAGPAVVTTTDVGPNDCICTIGVIMTQGCQCRKPSTPPAAADKTTG